jgi:MinD-like ATPase involved in chromosome partitioning or flagellar assembly
LLSQRAHLTRALILPNEVRSPSEADEIVARLKSLVDRFLGISVEALPAVPYDPMVPRAAAAGIPLIVHTPESPAARALQKASRRIDSLSQPPTRSNGALPRWTERVAAHNEENRL